MVSSSATRKEQGHDDKDDDDDGTASSSVSRGSTTSSSRFRLAWPSWNFWRWWHPSETGTATSADFQIFQALEIQDEAQKIRLARFLRELHQLVQDGGGLDDSTSSSSSSSSSSDSTRRKKNNNIIPHHLKRKKTKRGEISLRGINLKQLSRQGDDHKKSIERYLDEMRNGRHFSRDSIIDLVDATTDLCLKDETMVDLRARNASTVTVVGDIHGSLPCLDCIMGDINDRLDTDPDHHVVFCGDYVDRGPHSLEVFCYLMFLKIKYPNNVVLLRGNHEDIFIASAYGFQDEIRKKYGPIDADILWAKMSKIFSSLPYCARTEHAWITHGGLPSNNFKLSDINDKITANVRVEIESVVQPANEIEKILCGFMWSDPSNRRGVSNNPRGTGIEFGPDVAYRFMRDHGIKYIIRGHEPVEEGIKIMPCRNDTSVVTVFSTANYPNGQGSNLGAVLHLDEASGEIDCTQFRFKKEDNEHYDSQKSEAYKRFLTDYVSQNRAKLEADFKKIELDGLVTTNAWANLMAKRISSSSPDAWIELRPALAPTTTPCGKYIDWNQFLHKYSPKLETLEDDQVSLVHENKDELIRLFKVLDADGNGSIDKEEFMSGVAVLNKTCLQGDKKFTDPAKLFDLFDVDGNGEIDIQEFTSVIERSETARNLTNSVDPQKIDVLQKNHEMLLMVFQFLDRDGSGTLDRNEFKTGIALLNKRLPLAERFDDPDELFNAMDVDGNGEVSINEFNTILQQAVSP